MKRLKSLKTVAVNFSIVLMLVGLFTLTMTNDVRSVFSPAYNNLFYRGNTAQKNVTLMVNVYWGNEYLPSMLQSFKDYGIKTTFFVGGMWVSKYPEDFLSIVNDGHEIGNHGFFHKDHSKLSYKENQQEIFDTHKIVKQYTDTDMCLFAPPSGAFNDYTIQTANNLGYKVIMWSRDTIDWRDKDSNLIYERATKNLGNGELILMHPTLQTAQALPKILEYCKQNNFEIVPISSNITI